MGQTHDITKSHTLGWATHKWECYIAEDFQQEYEWDSPVQGSCTKVRPQSMQLWRPFWLNFGSPIGLGAIETPLLKGVHKILYALGLKSKAVIWQEPGPTCWSWAVFWRGGERRGGWVVTVAQPEDTDNNSGSHNWGHSAAWTLLLAHELQVLILIPHNSFRHQRSDASGQPTGENRAPPINKLPKDEPTVISRHAWRHVPSHLRATSSLPTINRQPLYLPSGSLLGTLDQPHATWGRHQMQENHDPSACRPSPLTPAQTLPWDQLGRGSVH